MFLYDFVSKFKIYGKVLDVGGGCGILGLLLKRDFDVELDIVEKQPAMCEFIKKNLTANAQNANLICSDFLDLDCEKRYDFVVSNPPFYKGTLKSDNEIKKIARYEEFLPMKKFFKKVNCVLKERGEFIFCYDAKRVDEIAFNMPNPLKIVDLRFMHPKINKDATLVMIRAKRHAKSMVKVHPPLIAFEGNEYSKETASIYERAATKSIKI
jgi:tRNA1(Val) A37 N6-methylase TrmN6